ncbi:MAG: peptidase S10 [Bacteroidales bacterium]|nr:peptidase S10 [Bacteroidales bacterium]
MIKKSLFRLLAGMLVVTLPIPLLAQQHATKDHIFKPQDRSVTTEGSVTVEGNRIDYTATAGNIFLTNEKGDTTAKMFYVAYAKKGETAAHRPVTFFWNGGPGSASVWIHMGAFGPKVVKMNDHTHTPAAPYTLLNNDYSLLDVTDEVFVDAVGTGYSRIIGANEGGAGKPKDFYGIDGDGQAFAQFIRKYLSEYNRWNSPKYLFGESYGTTRAAVLSSDLEMGQDIDPNGIILLSSILDFHTASFTPGNDLPYELILPSYTAVAWYHHMLPNQPKELLPLLEEVKHFALNDFAQALAQGNNLDSTARMAIINKLHNYTGLTTAYLDKANMRVTGAEFEKELLSGKEETTGRLDARFTGPTMDPLSQAHEYDPHSAAFGSAYISLFNDYVHNTLHYGNNMHYRPFAGNIKEWDWKHHVRGVGQSFSGGSPNVAVDLVRAMKYNPDLKVMVNSGYFDLGTPFFATIYTFDHFALPKSLQSNLVEKFYFSGHMVYQHQPSHKKLHDNVAAFIRETDNLGK